MRLSEKTLELSICSQFAALLNRQVIWFGLTQRQEARAGFDACTRLGARLVILQFKASNELRDGGATRRFRAPHRQMEALRRRVRGPREIFYVLPDLGTTHDLGTSWDLLSRTWVLDVALLPSLVPPVTWKGTPRSDHYLDLAPPAAGSPSRLVTVRSDPVEVKAIPLSELAPQLLGVGEGRPEGAMLLDRSHGERSPFSRKSLALGIGPAAASPPASKATRAPNEAD